MIKMEGTLLRLGVKDVCDQIFSENCEVEFPEKIPFVFDFSTESKNVIGHAIPKRDSDKKEIVVDVVVPKDDILSERKYNIGGWYTNVRSHLEGDCVIIDSCKLIAVSILSESEKAIDGQILIRKEE